MELGDGTSCTIVGETRLTGNIRSRCDVGRVRVRTSADRMAWLRASPSTPLARSTAPPSPPAPGRSEVMPSPDRRSARLAEIITSMSRDETRRDAQIRNRVNTPKSHLDRVLQTLTHNSVSFSRSAVARRLKPQIPRIETQNTKETRGPTNRQSTELRRRSQLRLVVIPCGTRRYALTHDSQWCTRRNVFLPG